MDSDNVRTASYLLCTIMESDLCVFSMNDRRGESYDHCPQIQYNLRNNRTRQTENNITQILNNL